MRTSKTKTTTVYTNSKADGLIAKQTPKITEQVKTFALDLANKSLPKVNDPLSLYLPVILTLFQSLLEQVHKIIGAQRLDSEMKAVKENYQKEEETLENVINNTTDELRLLKKRVKELAQNLGHIIRNWRIALFFLGLLSFSEIFLNFKIFLPLSSNNGSALISATGIAISFFIINHVFPNILNFFSEHRTKIVVGVSIIAVVTALLYSFAKLRLSYASSLENASTEHISEWNFVILNLVLFLSGTALTIIYKPSKNIVANYQLHKKVSNDIKAKQNEFTTAEKRLSILTKEKNDRLNELEGVGMMAQSYERVLESSYLEHVAIWSRENLISRKISEQTPKCFLETPTPLTKYFQHQNNHNSQNPTNQ